jgi:formylmethanofuran dehydrogenase subunit E
MSTQQKVSKICHKCGKDVSGQPREKDEEGRYWCIPCGEADKLQRLYRESGICEGCGESPGQAALLLMAGQNLCPACRRRKFKYGIDKSKPQSKGLIGSIKSLFGK